MNPRVTLVVVAVFAVLLGYVYFVELNKTPEQLGTPAPTQASVFSLNSTEINSIQVRDLHSTRIVQLEQKDSTWQVQKPESKPADTQAVASVLTSLTSLQATRVLTDVGDLKSFGLAPASLEVRLVTTNTVPYAITIGDKTPDGSGYYAVYTGDKSKVFIINASSVTDLQAWLNTPPYEPTPTPTFTATPPPTATPVGTPPPTPAATATP